MQRFSETLVCISELKPCLWRHTLFLDHWGCGDALFVWLKLLVLFSVCFFYRNLNFTANVCLCLRDSQCHRWQKAKARNRGSRGQKKNCPRSKAWSWEAVCGPSTVQESKDELWEKCVSSKRNSTGSPSRSLLTCRGTKPTDRGTLPRLKDQKGDWRVLLVRQGKN